MKKIIFTDLDGTLLNDQRLVSDKNKAAIDRCLKEGHRVVITTGRPLASAKLLVEELGLTGEGCYAIASNGALLYDCYHDTILKQITIPREYLPVMFQSAHEDHLHIHTYTDTHVVCEEDRKEVHWYEHEIRVPVLIVEDIMKYIDFDPLKIIVLNLDDHQKLVDFQKKMAPYAAGRMDSLFSNQMILEYCPIGVSKGKAVTDLCELLNIPREDSIAAGDAENDISMIEAAGVGCCMCNGFPEVKECSDYITTADNNHDGFAEIIDKFVFMSTN